MKKEKNKAKSITNRPIRWSIPILLLGILFVCGIKNTYYNKLLEEKGVCIKAIVIDNYRTGRKGTMNIEYKFKVNNITYTNSDMSSELVGDTISVIYLPNDPTINRPCNILH